MHKGKIQREFKTKEHVLLKVKSKKSFLNLGSCTELKNEYCGPFEILDRIGSVAYMLAMPATIKVHDMFHVSLLEKYVHDPNHVVDWALVQVEQIGDF